MSDRLTLADVLARDVPMEWHEAVGLVRAVAARVIDTVGEATVPELHQIEIAHDGRVEVTGGNHSSDPVRRLGQLLQAMLGHSSPPVQLRLLITQATAPTPSFGSIGAFDEALAYYERPGRDILVQALHSRAIAAPRADDSAPVPTLDTVAPLPATEPQKQSDKRSSRNSKRHGLQAAAAAAILVLLCAGGAWYTRTIGAGRDASAMASMASDALGDVVMSTISAVTERVGLGRVVSAESAIGESPAASLTTPANDPRIRRPAAPVDQPAAPIVLFDVDAHLPDAAEDPVSAVLATAVPSKVAAEETRTGATVYSAESDGVSPPTGMRPQLPRALPSNANPEFCRVDLIVSEEGTVESVKLAGTPCTVRESMFLSAAKAWQFQPALKDGLPVRYRKTVWLAAR